MEDNAPYGFEDPGIKQRHSGQANRSDDRKFRERFKEFPQTPEDADIAINVIRKSVRALDRLTQK
jgi:hypothetical protein